MVSGSLKLLLNDLASDLVAGEHERTVCPKCKGGGSGEHSFIITMQTYNAVYKCFRAKCGFQGAISLLPNPEKKPKVPKKVYTGKLEPIPSSLWETHFKPYDISQATLLEQGISFATDINRIRFPLYDYRGYMFGENLRAISPEQKPKALINKFNDVPNLHFPLRVSSWPYSSLTTSSTIMLVEDQVSALKLSYVKYCAALMGTNLSDEGLMQLRQIGIKTVILMLDGDDAGLKASMTLKEKLSPFFIVKVILLEKGKDPKDLSMGQLNEEINKCLRQ